jgi:hypothetical protein
MLNSTIIDRLVQVRDPGRWCCLSFLEGVCNGKLLGYYCSTKILTETGMAASVKYQYDRSDEEIHSEPMLLKLGAGTSWVLPTFGE